MAESNTRQIHTISTVSQHHTGHRATQHTTPHATHTKSHHAGHATHTTHSTATRVSPTSTSSISTSTGFSYPTPTSIPKTNATIMGLSITVAFLVIILGAATAVIVVKTRRAKREWGSYRDSGSVLSEEDEQSRGTRIWHGIPIRAQVPANGYGVDERE